MAKKISSKDLFEQEDIFKGVRDSAKNTLETLENLEKQLKGVAEGLKSAVSGMKIDSAKGLKEFADATAKSNDLVKESIEIAKLKAEADQQVRKAEQELVKLEKLKSQEAERQAKAEEKKIAQTKNTSSAYQQLVIQTRELKNQSKELGAQLLQLSKDGKQNTAEFQKLQQEYEDVTTASQQLDKELKGLDKTVGDNFRNVGNYTEGMSEMKNESANLRTRLRELMIQLQNMDQADPRFQQMTREAGELKDQIDDTSATIRASAGNAVENLSGGFVEMSKLGVAGFQAVEGSMALFGVESENVQKSLTRLTALMNLSDSLKTLGELDQKFIEIKTSMTAFGSKALTAFRNLTTAGKAFAVTGLGLAITGVGLLIANWDKITGKTAENTAEQERNNKAKEEAQRKAEELKQKQDAENESVAESSTKFVALVEQLKKTNQNSDERFKLMKKINAEYGTTLKNLKDETAFQTQLNQAVADYIIFQRLKVRQQSKEGEITDALKKQEDIIREFENKFGGFISTEAEKEFLTSPGSVFPKLKNFKATPREYDEVGKLVSKYSALQDELNDKAKTALDIQNELSKYQYKPTTPKTTKDIKNTTTALSKYNDALKAYYDAIERDRISRITDAQEKEIQEIMSHYETLYGLADNAGKDTKDLKEQELKDINAVIKKYKDQEKQLYIDAQAEIDRATIRNSRELADIVEGLQEDNYQATLTEKQREIRAINDKYFELEENAKGNADQLKIIAEAKARELSEINKKYNEEEIKSIEENNRKLIETATNYFIEQSNKRIEQIDKEIEASQKQYDTLKELAEQGNINAQQSLAEQQRILTEANRKKEKEQQRQQRIELAKSVYTTYSSKVEAGSKNALAETIRDTTLLQQFINSLPAFEKGTEDTGKNGLGVDGKGGFHAILHPNERVIPKSLNQQIGNLTNEELTKIATEYNNGRLLKHNKTESSLEFALMVNELKNIKDVIANKPETNIELGQITQSAIEIVNRTKKGNTTIYNRYKVRK